MIANKRGRNGFFSFEEGNARAEVLSDISVIQCAFTKMSQLHNARLCCMEQEKTS